MKNTKQGFIIPLIIIILAVLAIGGGVYAYHEKKVADVATNENVNVNSSSSITNNTSGIPSQPVTTTAPTTVNTQAPSSAGSIISFSITPSTKTGTTYTYSYGAKAVLTAKNLASVNLMYDSYGNNGSSQTITLGKMNKVSGSDSGDTWEYPVASGIHNEPLYVEAKDEKGITLKGTDLMADYQADSTLTITSPARNSLVQKGTSQQITWSITNPIPNSIVEIQIEKVPRSGESFINQQGVVLDQKVSSSGSYTWNVPSSIEPREYEMKIYLFGNSTDTYSIGGDDTSFIVQ